MHQSSGLLSLPSRSGFCLLASATLGQDHDNAVAERSNLRAAARLRTIDARADPTFKFRNGFVNSLFPLR